MSNNPDCKSNIPPDIAKAIKMVRNGHDVTGPNPGYQRRMLERRLKRLRDGFAELRRKAPYIIPASVDMESKEIQGALGYDGTEGQDRQNYSDDQDRENYTIKDEI